MAQSFYGNTKNLSTKSSFIFDRIYKTRYEMEQACSTDGIYNTRFVLVEYGDKKANVNNFCISSASTREADLRAIFNNSTNNTYTSLAEIGDIFRVDTTGTGADYYLIEDKDSPLSGLKFSAQNDVTKEYWLNYSIDYAKYSDDYDSTVWEKIFSAGQEKYIQVARLNAVLPSMEVISDAPSMNPHIDVEHSTSENIIFHLPEAWKFSYGSIEFSKEGCNAEKHYWTDTEVTPDRIEWTETASGAAYPAHNITYYKIVNNKTLTEGDFIAGNYYVIDGYLDKDKTLPKYVKANTKYATFKLLQSKSPDVYEIDSISVIYDANGKLQTSTTELDTQQLNIILPSIGNTICTIWDLIYGTGDPDTGERNTFIGQASDTPEGEGREVLDTTDPVYTLAGVMNYVIDLLGFPAEENNPLDLDKYGTIIEMFEGLVKLYGNSSDGYIPVTDVDYYYEDDSGKYVKVTNKAGMTPDTIQYYVLLDGNYFPIGPCYYDSSKGWIYNIPTNYYIKTANGNYEKVDPADFKTGVTYYNVVAYKDTLWNYYNDIKDKASLYQADWDEDSPQAIGYIKNRPIIYNENVADDLDETKSSEEFFIPTKSIDLKWYGVEQPKVKATMVNSNGKYNLTALCENTDTDTVKNYSIVGSGITTEGDQKIYTFPDDGTSNNFIITYTNEYGESYQLESGSINKLSIDIPIELATKVADITTHVTTANTLDDGSISTYRVQANVSGGLYLLGSDSTGYYFDESCKDVDAYTKYTMGWYLDNANTKQTWSEEEYNVDIPSTTTSVGSIKSDKFISSALSLGKSYCAKASVNKDVNSQYRFFDIYKPDFVLSATPTASDRKEENDTYIYHYDISVSGGFPMETTPNYDLYVGSAETLAAANKLTKTSSSMTKITSLTTPDWYDIGNYIKFIAVDNLGFERWYIRHVDPLQIYQTNHSGKSFSQLYCTTRSVYTYTEDTTNHKQTITKTAPKYQLTTNFYDTTNKVLRQGVPFTTGNDPYNVITTSGYTTTCTHTTGLNVDNSYTYVWTLTGIKNSYPTSSNITDISTGTNTLKAPGWKIGLTDAIEYPCTYNTGISTFKPLDIYIVDLEKASEDENYNEGILLNAIVINGSSANNKIKITWMESTDSSFPEDSTTMQASQGNKNSFNAQSYAAQPKVTTYYKVTVEDEINNEYAEARCVCAFHTAEEKAVIQSQIDTLNSNITDYKAALETATEATEIASYNDKISQAEKSIEALTDRLDYEVYYCINS